MAVINGTSGPDNLSGTSGDDIINALEGDDVVHADDGNDTIYGGSGSDILWGDGGDDTIYGGDNPDDLNGGLGNDTLDGGAGDDAALFGWYRGSFTITFDAGVITVVGPDGTDTLTNIERLRFLDTSIAAPGLGVIVDGTSGSDTITGGPGDEVINGMDSPDTISGAGGNDTIYGGSGTDRLDGGDGSDWLFGGDNSDDLIGGPGNDTLDGGNGDDAAIYFGNRFTSAVYNPNFTGTLEFNYYTAVDANGTVTVSGPEGVDALIGIERIRFADQSIPIPKAGITIAGGSIDETFTGGAGDDLLDGGDGNDVLDGGPGNDILFGSAGNDTASYASAPSAVTVDLTFWAHAQDTGGAGVDTLISIENLVGSAFNDTLTGDYHDNIIEGGLGDDILAGGTGIDTASYAAAPSAVTVDLAISGPQATGGEGSDTLTSFENLTGSAFNDTLLGDNSANVIHGGDGADTLDGRGGADQLFGDNGDDTIQIDGVGFRVIDGGAGTDTLSYAAAASGVSPVLSNPNWQGTGGGGSAHIASIENVIGSGFNDNITGDGGANRLDGGAGGDTLSGAGGDDSLVGGAGADVQTGGAGNDTFIFQALSDTTVAAPDLITDFTSGDLIDLTAIDADTVSPGDQAFHLGSTPGHTGDIVVSYDGGSNTTTLYLYVDADTTPDGRITLLGDHSGLAAGDFGL